MDENRALEAAMHLTALLHEAVLQPEHWPVALERLAAEFGAAVANLRVLRLDDMEQLAGYHSRGDPATIRRLVAYHGHLGHDPRLEAAAADPGRPARTLDLVSEQEWRASPLYRNVLRPAGLYETLGVMVAAEEGETATFAEVVRKKEAPPFTEEDVARMQLYVPHFRALANVINHRRQTNAGCDAAVTALDALALGVLVVDCCGEIVHANTAGRAILAAKQAMGIAAGRLCATDPDLQERLAAAISKPATAGTARSEAELEQVIVAEDGETPLRISVAQADVASKTPAARDHAVVILRDTSRRCRTDVERLQHLFSLTPAEADVLQRFVAGDSLRTIAETSGRAYETVRNQMKQVMSKVGVDRQTELMRVVLTVVVD